MIPLHAGQAIPLPVVAEFSYTQETDTYPKTEYSNLQFRGPLDVEAFREAYREVLRAEPVPHSLLEERRVGGAHRLHWVVQDTFNDLIYEDCRQAVPQPLDPVRFIEDYHSQRTVRRMDLFREPPVRFFLLRLADDVHLLSILYHHIGLDGAHGYAMIRDILARYHEKVAGSPPEWTQAQSITSQSVQKGALPRPPWIVSSFFRQMRDIGLWTGGRISLVATQADRDVKGRMCYRAVFDEPEVLSGLRAVAKRNQATVTDALMAALARSIGSWDRDHGGRKEFIRSMLAVNIRNRVEMDESLGMRMSALFWAVRRPEELGVDEAVRVYRDARVRRLAQRQDVGLYRMLQVSAAVAMLVPLRYRSWIMRRQYEVPTTFVLSNIGVMWPRVEEGRPTGETCLDRAGELVVDDVHSCPSASPYIGVGVISRTLHGKLFVNFSCDHRHFLREEAAALMEGFQADLRALALS